MWTINFHFECLNTRRVESKKKEVHFYFGFSPNAIWAISPRMPWPLSLVKTLKQAKRGERLFNVNFTILIQSCCSSIQFHIKLARLVITPKKWQFSHYFYLNFAFEKKNPKPRILFLKEAFINTYKKEVKCLKWKIFTNFQQN